MKKLPQVIITISLVISFSSCSYIHERKNAVLVRLNKPVEVREAKEQRAHRRERKGRRISKVFDSQGRVIRENLPSGNYNTYEYQSNDR